MIVHRVAYLQRLLVVGLPIILSGASDYDFQKNRWGHEHQQRILQCLQDPYVIY